MFKNLIKWLFRLFALAIFSAIIVAIMLFIDYKRFLNTPIVVDDSSPTLIIKSGESINSLVHLFDNARLPLAAKSFISPKLGKYYFRYLAKSTKKTNQLKIGEYQLTKGMKPSELLDLLVSGKTISYKVTFVEGWNFKQLRKALSSNKNIKQTLGSIPDNKIISILGLDEKLFYEGQFFPDTYQFSNGTKDIEVLKQAYQLMQKNLDAAWKARDKSIKLKNPYELLIMASLIEKETSIDSERKQISGVFHRRLLKGMLLQTDPTVIYGMGNKYKGKIYKSDLKKDTPYNTYTRKGLTPTPIAMPGMSSLLAAGQPDKSNTLYFVADGTGGHAFTATYKKHLKAVRAYRKQLKKK